VDGGGEGSQDVDLSGDKNAAAAGCGATAQEAAAASGCGATPQEEAIQQGCHSNSGGPEDATKGAVDDGGLC